MGLLNLDELPLNEQTKRPVITLVGRVDPSVSVQLAGRLRELVAAGERELAVDLAGARDVHGALLGVLAMVRAQLTAPVGSPPIGSLLVSGVALPQFLAALEAAALDEVFVVYDAVRHEHPPAGAQAQVPFPRHSTETRAGGVDRDVVGGVGDEQR